MSVSLSPHVCMCMCVYIYVYACMHVYECAYMCMCMFVHVCVRVCICVCVWSEDNSQESLLLHHLVPRHQTQVLRFGSRALTH